MYKSDKGWNSVVNKFWVNKLNWVVLKYKMCVIYNFSSQQFFENERIYCKKYKNSIIVRK